MTIGRILTGGLGTFGGRRYLPTLGYGSFAGGVTPSQTLCTESVSVYSPGWDDVSVSVPGYSASYVYSGGIDSVQVGCCHGS